MILFYIHSPIIWLFLRPAVAVKELFTAKASCEFVPKLKKWNAPTLGWWILYCEWECIINTYIYYIDDTEILDTCCILFSVDENVVQVFF